MDVIAIPIYRCTIDQHSSEMENAKKRLVKFCRAEEGSESIRIIGNSFDHDKWYPWKYNEIVGWVSLEISGNKLTGELWYVKQKVSQKLIKKRYHYEGKVFEVFLNHVYSQPEIAGQIFETFTEWWKNRMYFKQRYIDIEELRTRLSFIDWPRVKTASNTLLNLTIDTGAPFNTI